MHLTGTELGDHMLLVTTPIQPGQGSGDGAGSPGVSANNVASGQPSTTKLHTPSSSTVTPSTTHAALSQIPQHLLPVSMMSPSMFNSNVMGGLGMGPGLGMPFGVGGPMKPYPYMNPLTAGSYPGMNPLLMQQFDPAKAEEIARTIYVGNIYPPATEDEIRVLFASHGPIAHIKVAGDAIVGPRFAFIEYGMFQSRATVTGLIDSSNSFLFQFSNIFLYTL